MCSNERLDGSEWRRESISYTLTGYRDGWLGLLDHLLDIFAGRPTRATAKDYTFSVLVKGSAELYNPQTENKEG